MAMMLDQWEARLWADFGPARSNSAAGIPQRLLKGVKTMIERNYEHLRRLALAIAALVVSTSFVGVAVLPGLLGLPSVS